MCLLGDNAVGKSSLIRRYVHDIFEDRYLPTIGTNVTQKSIKLRNPKNNTQINMSLLIWDIMGDMTNLEELIHSYTRYSAQKKYFENAKGGIIICDLTRPSSLKNISDWVNSFRDVVGDVPIVILGNKIDLKLKCLISEEELAEVARKYGSQYLLTSAKSGQNVELAFSKLAKAMAFSLIKK